MKFSKLVLAIAMLGIAAATYTNAQVIRQTTSDVNKAKTAPHELRCRGGVTYRDRTYYVPAAQELEISITEGRLTEATNERMMNMSVTFTPGTQAVNVGSNLESGQCSWVDRGVHPGEPFQIRQEIIYFGQLTQAQQGTVDRSATAAERHPDSMNVPEYLNDSSHYWSFFVHNTGRGYFEATSSNYWNPLNISSDVRKAGSRSKATGTNQDELNPQPLPPCEKCPEMRKTPAEEKKKPR